MLQVRENEISLIKWSGGAAQLRTLRWNISWHTRLWFTPLNFCQILKIRVLARQISIMLRQNCNETSWGIHTDVTLQLGGIQFFKIQPSSTSSVASLISGFTTNEALQAVKGLCSIYTILNLECSKCARMRFAQLRSLERTLRTSYNRNVQTKSCNDKPVVPLKCVFLAHRVVTFTWLWYTTCRSVWHCMLLPCSTMQLKTCSTRTIQYWSSSWWKVSFSFRSGKVSRFAFRFPICFVIPLGKN